MAEIYKVDQTARKFLFEGVQGENEARSIQFDITPWTTELGNGAVTATAKRPTDAAPYPVTVTRDGNTVTWKPTSTDTAIDGAGMFQLEYTVDSVLAKTCIWSTMVAPSLDPAGDPPDPYDNWLAEMREIAADAIQAAQDADESADDAQAEVYEAEAWAKGTKNGTPVSSSDAQYQNNSKYYSEESNKNAEAWAVGQRGGVDVPSTDETYHNNAKYYAEQSLANQYGAYIVKSASGDIASFSDGADNVPMKSLNVQIVPKQSGSGDPSPSNVRPITGWTDADVKVAGKNLFSNVFTDYTMPSDYRICPIKLEMGKQYTLSAVSDTSITGITVGIVRSGTRYADFEGFTIIVNSQGQVPAYNNPYRFTATEIWKDANLVIYARTEAEFSNALSAFKVQLEEGTARTEYEPYIGHTTPVPLGQTVYGANGDAVSGAWKKTKNVADLGSLTWEYNSTYGVFIAVFPNDSQPATSIGRDAMCERYTAQIGATLTALQDGKFLFNSTQISSGARLAIKDTAYTDAAAFKTAMDGVKFVYDLATPTTFSVDPTEVRTLLGQNNVWADCGSVAVEYRADPTLAYNELANVIVSLGGNL